MLSTLIYLKGDQYLVLKKDTFIACTVSEGPQGLLLYVVRDMYLKWYRIIMWSLIFLEGDPFFFSFVYSSYIFFYPL